MHCACLFLVSVSKSPRISSKLIGWMKTMRAIHWLLIQMRWTDEQCFIQLSLTIEFGIRLICWNLIGRLTKLRESIGRISRLFKKIFIPVVLPWYCCHYPCAIKSNSSFKSNLNVNFLIIVKVTCKSIFEFWIILSWKA